MTDQERSAALVIANPFYCLRTVDTVFTLEHEPIITEDRFIAAGVNLIKEIGPAEYIRLLLENLKHPI
jgi:hypothetical protein